MSKNSGIFELISAGTRSMILMAQDLAIAKRHKVITTGHLLAAMFSPRLDDMRFLAIFKDCKITSDDIEKQINSAEQSKSNNEFPCFSPKVTTLIKIASELATKSSYFTIEVIHFFSAIYRLPICQAYKILTKELDVIDMSYFKNKSDSLLCEPIIHKTIKKLDTLYSDLHSKIELDTNMYLATIMAIGKCIEELQGTINELIIPLHLPSKIAIHAGH